MAGNELTAGGAEAGAKVRCEANGSREWKKMIKREGRDASAV